MTVLTATYDDALSRVRLSATGLSGPAVTARFEWSPDAIVWSTVRGGSLMSVVATTAALDHYEFAAQVTNNYRVVELDAAGVVLANTVIQAGAPMDRIWLKVPAAPYANLKIALTGWSEIERQSRSGVFAVTGRRDAVAVTELPSGRRLTVHLRTADDAATAALDLVLRLGLAVHLHIPPTCTLTGMHAVVGGYRWTRPTPHGHVGRFTVALEEVAPPDVSLAAPTVTYAALARLYATYADLAAANGTYAALPLLPGSAIDALAGT